MAVPTINLGKDAKMFVGAAGSVPTVELSNVENVKMTGSAELAEASVRAHNGWKSNYPTLRDLKLTFNCRYDATDASVSLIERAALASNLVAIKVLHKTSGNGPDADWAIESFDQSQELNGIVNVEISASLAVLRSYTS